MAAIGLGGGSSSSFLSGVFTGALDNPERVADFSPACVAAYAHGQH
jgi:hypothetical protein